MAVEARNRTLDFWFRMIRTGETALPRFQRHEAWSYTDIVSLLESIIQDLPVGSALVLGVGEQPPFISRAMEGAPSPTERTNEHLLDGQQRITALWRSLHDSYKDRKYFLVMKEDRWGITSVRRYEKNGQSYPLWADTPKEQYERHLVPISLVCPGADANAIGEWCDEVEMARPDERRLTKLRAQVENYNFPFLNLPITTPRDVAIDVFVRLNTNQETLSTFDILVAQTEGQTGESLHQLVESISRDMPDVLAYTPVENLVLRVAALREDREPYDPSFSRLIIPDLIGEWDSIRVGIKEMISFLEGERIFDSQRLPTVTVLPVIAAIFSKLPSLDAAGNARKLLKQYLWRAFFTSRYESAAHTAALNDYRYLRAQITGEESTSVSIFDDDQYPLVSMDELKEAGWPKRRDTLARGILAVFLRSGSLDFADESLANRESLKKREYHHLFPERLLVEDGKMQKDEVDRALNCALITWNTNRSIAAKAPLDYLRERPRSCSNVLPMTATPLAP